MEVLLPFHALYIFLNELLIQHREMSAGVIVFLTLNLQDYNASGEMHSFIRKLKTTIELNKIRSRIVTE